MTATHNGNNEYLTALSKWKSCKPPYTGSHMRICVTAVKIILSHIDKPRRSKYEKENYLRLDFSKAGKVTFYAEFPKSMTLKGRQLGEWPEMTLDVAREKVFYYLNTLIANSCFAASARKWLLSLYVGLLM